MQKWGMQNYKVRLMKTRKKRRAGKTSHPIEFHGAHSAFVGQEERVMVDLFGTRGGVTAGKQE